MRCGIFRSIVLTTCACIIEHVSSTSSAEAVPQHGSAVTTAQSATRGLVQHCQHYPTHRSAGRTLKTIAAPCPTDGPQDLHKGKALTSPMPKEAESPAPGLSRTATACSRACSVCSGFAPPHDSICSPPMRTSILRHVRVISRQVTAYRISASDGVCFCCKAFLLLLQSIYDLLRVSKGTIHRSTSYS